LIASGGKRPGSPGKKKSNSSGSKGPKPGDICNYCKETGHWKNQCPKKKRQEHQQQQKQAGTAAVAESDSQSEEDIALVAEEPAHHTDVWIPDSGASYHICPRREWFITYEQATGGNIYMPNSIVCKVAGIGSIQIRTHDGKFCTLNNVRHVHI